ncbi:hypothetical protein LR48_Vigan1091s000300 [Vigna angularis]|uniref:Uncharacterized protein n=1 Tax=Phaseolus angularis TaxID=3914 RepID=A0A0L9TII7_PHAAN|nr:hypothetical protein LR48_Vigan1091s000300 [Vigna angularis]
MEASALKTAMLTPSMHSALSSKSETWKQCVLKHEQRRHKHIHSLRAVFSRGDLRFWEKSEKEKVRKLECGGNGVVQLPNALSCLSTQKKETVL